MDCAGETLQKECRPINQLPDTSFVLHARASRHYWKGRGLLSIKSFRHGIAYYKTDDGTFLVDDERFLVFNHAQEYEIIIDADQPVNSFCIFFASDLTIQVQRSVSTPTTRLLDDPGAADGCAPLFFERTYPHDHLLSPTLARFRAGYPQHEHDTLWLDEQLCDLMEKLLALQQISVCESDALPSVRRATRLELYRRLHLARDYITACYSQPISLQAIATVAGLSPNHLLRSFKALFGQTPYQMLIAERLRRARFLLAHTDQPVTQICFDVGYESPSSFSTLFTQECGLSPQAFRLLNRSA